ncbi:hypothetical protein OG963_43385 (plasmid) [Streptomyces sp. NBC_01707]|uniref:hypothetical protein n=1 Tax=Streptomyces sp. NBC_01707 TaxID=2975914 RepID=UPI002F90DB58
MHPQTEPAGAWYLIVSDGVAFDGGPDYVVGPYESDDEAWHAHDRMNPRPCLLHYDVPPPAGRRELECYCVVLEAIRERAAA